ncbi:alkaline phosphatase [Carboxylicivirga sp. A043]|uniref:alkaline phosphatase n=1 Tax=Carboxylicivirga litoralis TaxID=2816963 RepID=UPI0021CB26D4|nr:alkaline phosphatase [Carboxylicivirga sp. A043]MCU4156369.1 alkaline phosphatase [Carboxylicivirga sp. A043]
MKALSNFKSAAISFAIMASIAIVYTSCGEDEKIVEVEVEKEVEKIVEKEIDPRTDYKTPKYVFFFIGDGMANVQLNAAEAALNSSDFGLKSVGVGALNMQEFKVSGMQTTHAEDQYITDSAAAATALATGKKTTVGTISVNADDSEDFKTMAEMAKEQGIKVGIISSVSIDHATPASFYAHTSSRNNYYTIGQDLAKSNFDYFGGGGVRWNKYDSDGETSGLAEDVNLFLNALSSNAYTYVDTKSEFEALTSESGKVFATLETFKTDVSSNSAALPYEIDRPADQLSLADFTKKGIEVLDNEDGFFMMVEGGKIDWACHANDAVASAMDVIAFDKAVGHAIDFYNEHPDETLIIVTGDHETGGLTLGYGGTKYSTAFTLLNYQKMSYDAYYNNIVKSWDPATITFDEALASAKEYFGLGDADKTELLTNTQNGEVTVSLQLSTYEEERLREAFNLTIDIMNGSVNYWEACDGYDIDVFGGNSYNPFVVTVTHILNEKAGLDWTSYSHTAVPVPVLAMGQGEYVFTGYYDNTDIAKKIIEVAGYNK